MYLLLLLQTFSTNVVINIGGNELNQSEKRASPLYKGEVTFLPQIIPSLSDWIGFKQKDGLLASGKRKGVPPKHLVSFLNSEKNLKEKNTKTA